MALRHQFPKAGLLCLLSANLVVAAVASYRFVVLSPAGPFGSSLDYYIDFADQYLALIADGQLYTAYLVDTYLVHRFLKDNPAQLIEQQDDDQAPEHSFLEGAHISGD
ncbi:hypothetical protein VTI74DRAFT_9952 [Chaetomium olivicolor]